MRAHNFIDLTGKQFGKLTVIEFHGKDERRKSIWKCLCDCGKESLVPSTNLIGNRTNSCGCLVKEKARQNFHKHGLTNSSEYRSWSAMIKRCTNPKHDKYQYYGGRGINVCEQWLTSFENFFNDMGHKPSRNHSIDRKDVNGDYTPDNCVWTTTEEQMRNKRIPVNNKSGIKGVHWCKVKNKWIASISNGAKQLTLGTYSNKEDAIKARKDAELKYWGKSS